MIDMPTINAAAATTAAAATHHRGVDAVSNPSSRGATAGAGTPVPALTA